MNVSNVSVELVVVANISGGAAVEPPLVLLSRQIMFYSLAVIIPFGLVCNTISVCTFMSKRMRMRAASWYLAALALSDDMALLTVMIDYWMKDERINLPIVKKSVVLCVLVTHLSYASRLLSAWLVTTFTIERFIGVAFPLKRAKFSSTSHARKVIMAEVIFCLIATSFTLFTISIVQAPYGKECDVRADMSTVYLAFSVIFLIFGSIVIPILVICTLNLFIFLKIFQRKKTFTSQNTSSGGARLGSHKGCCNYTIATVLLVVSSTFVAMNAPYCVCWLMLFSSSMGASTNTIQWHLFAAKFILSVPYYLNYSINFALYSLCAGAFRKAVTQLILCRRQTDVSQWPSDSYQNSLRLDRTTDSISLLARRYNNGQRLRRVQSYGGCRNLPVVDRRLSLDPGEPSMITHTIIDAEINGRQTTFL